MISLPMLTFLFHLGTDPGNANVAPLDGYEIEYILLGRIHRVGTRRCDGILGTRLVFSSRP